MKRLFFFLFLALSQLTIMAQTQIPVGNEQPQHSFGYFSYKAVMEQTHDYALAQANLTKLREKYQAEMKRVEDEFNDKYELFLEGQRDFAPSIYQKRQAELQELIEKNIAFKQKAQDLLKKAEEDAYAPIRTKILAAVNRVGQAHQFDFIVNTDGDNMPFINPAKGIDVTQNILATLQ